MRSLAARLLLTLAVAGSLVACAEPEPAGPLLPDTPLETESPES